MERPTADEIQEWEENRVTKWVFSIIKDYKNSLGEIALDGQTLGGEPGMTAQLTARLVGEAAGLRFLLDKEYITFIDEKDD